MARPLRIQFLNPWYHVMNRGSKIIKGTKQRAIKDHKIKRPIDQIKRDLKVSQLNMDN